MHKFITLLTIYTLCIGSLHAVRTINVDVLVTDAGDGFLGLEEVVTGGLEVNTVAKVAGGVTPDDGGGGVYVWDGSIWTHRKEISVALKVQDDGGITSLTFVPPASYTIERSDDLETWTTAAPTGTVNNGDGTVTATTTASGSSGFYRVIELSTTDSVNGGEYTGTPAPFEIYRSDTAGQWKTDLTRISVRDDWAPSDALIGYVDAVNGDDGEDGLTMATAKETIENALVTGGFTTVYLAPGNYFPWDWDHGSIVNKSVALIGMEPNTVSIGYLGILDGESVTQNGTHDHLRDVPGQGNISTVYRTDLKDEWGAPLQLKNVASLALCSTTPESYYKAGTPETGSIVFNSAGDIGTHIEIASHSTTVGNDSIGIDGDGSANTVYFENIRFVGQNVTFVGGDTDSLCLSNCEIMFVLRNTSADALTILGIEEVLLYKTNIFYSNQKDLANYHQNGSDDVNAYEVDCLMVGASILGGTGSPPPNQASTMHDGGQIVRINGTYALSYQGIADTSTGTESWNLGCTFLNNSHSSVWALDDAVVNIDTCVFGGNPSAAHMYSDGTASSGAPVINYTRTNGYSTGTTGSGTINRLADGTP